MGEEEQEQQEAEAEAEVVRSDVKIQSGSGIKARFLSKASTRAFFKIFQ